MNIFKLLIPAVLLKKVYRKSYGSQPKSQTLSDKEQDEAQDLKDDNS